MPKPKPTDLAELGPIEAKNQEEALKHLKKSALLIGDVELLYMGITPSLRSPGGGIDSPDQLALAVMLTCNQLMMGRMLYTRSIIAALRMYQGDAFTHLRRAIETCAFAVRMNRHPNLCKVWSEAGFDNEKSYTAYRKAFRPEDVFPRIGHPDFNPKLVVLKDTFDQASKLLHGSVYGSANHFRLVPEGTNSQTSRNINFFDMPPDSFPSTFFLILETHLTILSLYGTILQPYMTEFPKWKTEWSLVTERTNRHLTSWKPTIQAWNAANKKT